MMKARIILNLSVGLILFLLGGFVMNQMVDAQQNMPPFPINKKENVWPMQDGDWNCWSNLDLGFTPKYLLHKLSEKKNALEDTELQKTIAAYFSCWPLIVCCSVEVLNKKAPFVPEYIIPQMVLQWVREGPDEIWGVRYPSTLLSDDWYKYPDNSTNYAFPSRINNNTIYCPELVSTFYITPPENIAVIENIKMQNRFGNFANFEYLPENPEYQMSKMCGIEEWLVKEKALKIRLK